MTKKNLKNVIVICDYAYVEGGATKVAMNSAIELQKHFHVVYFTAVGPVSKELEESQVEVVCLDQKDILHNENRLQAVKQGLYNQSSRNRLRTLLKQYSPDDTVVHVHTWTKALSSSIFKELEIQGFKVLLTVHDYFLVCPNGGLFNYKEHHICEYAPLSAKCVCTNCDSRNYGNKLFRVLRQRIQNKNIRSCHNISYIFISNFEREQLLRRNPGIHKQYFLLNPVDVGTRIKVPCENNQFYTYAARMTEDKGIRIFCEGITKANVKGLVLGNGILFDEMKKKYPNIEFTGWVDKDGMKKYMQKTRCYVFSSIYYEGAPLTPIEMMSCGIPCIVSDKNASRDLIEDGVNGFLYDGYDSDALAKKIALCKDDLLISKISNTVFHDFDNSDYSLHEHVSKLIQIYQETLGE